MPRGEEGGVAIPPPAILPKFSPSCPPPRQSLGSFHFPNLVPHGDTNNYSSNTIATALMGKDFETESDLADLGRGKGNRSSQIPGFARKGRGGV